MAARKTSKTTTKKAKTSKSGATASGKAVRKTAKAGTKATKKSSAKASKKKAPAREKAAAKPAASAPDSPRAETSALNINMGHIFALKPRVNTSFRQGDLAEARQRLKDESFDSLTAAARAVAEKAIELTHESGTRRGFKRNR